MTSFKRQLLLRLYLIQGLTHYKDKKTAIGHAFMMLNQTETLIKVYLALYKAWEEYCVAQMSQEGPWMDTSIFTSNEMIISPLFAEKVKVNFWIYYSLNSGSDTLKIQPSNKKWKAVNECHHLDIVHPMLVREWEALFYNHNKIEPEAMERLFVKNLVKALRGLKKKSAFEIEIELLEKARVNTLWDFLVEGKPLAVEDVAYIVDGDKVEVFSAPHGENFHDEEQYARLWNLNAKYSRLLSEGHSPEEAFALLK